MSATSTTTSYTVSVAQTGTEADALELSTDTMQLAVAIDSGGAGSDDLEMLLLGDAVAVGEDTFASITAAGVGSEAGGVSTVYGSLSATAATEATDGAFASAAAQIELLGDAEIVFTLTYMTSSVDQTADASAASASATSVLFAMTTGIAGEAAELLPDVAALDESLEQQPLETCGCGGGGDPELDGNIAVFDVDLAALGEDGYTAADVTAFVLEDEISSVTVAATVALG